MARTAGKTAAPITRTRTPAPAPAPAPPRPTPPASPAAKKKASPPARPSTPATTKSARPSIPGAKLAPPKSESFPLVSVLSRADMDRCIEIFKDDEEFAQEIKSYKTAREAMKTELVEIYKRNEIQAGGLRWGPFVAYVTIDKSRKTLSASLVKEAWVEAGMDASEVDGFYTEGKKSNSVKIVNTTIGAEETGDGDGDGAEDAG